MIHQVASPRPPHSPLAERNVGTFQGHVVDVLLFVPRALFHVAMMIVNLFLSLFCCFGKEVEKLPAQIEDSQKTPTSESGVEGEQRVTVAVDTPSVQTIRTVAAQLRKVDQTLTKDSSKEQADAEDLGALHQDLKGKEEEVERLEEDVSKLSPMGHKSVTEQKASSSYRIPEIGGKEKLKKPATTVLPHKVKKPALDASSSIKEMAASRALPLASEDAEEVFAKLPAKEKQAWSYLRDETYKDETDQKKLDDKLSWILDQEAPPAFKGWMENFVADMIKRKALETNTDQTAYIRTMSSLSPKQLQAYYQLLSSEILLPSSVENVNQKIAIFNPAQISTETEVVHEEGSLTPLAYHFSQEQAAAAIIADSEKSQITPENPTPVFNVNAENAEPLKANSALWSFISLFPQEAAECLSADVLGILAKETQRFEITEKGERRVKEFKKCLNAFLMITIFWIDLNAITPYACDEIELMLKTKIEHVIKFNFKYRGLTASDALKKKLEHILRVVMNKGVVAISHRAESRFSKKSQRESGKRCQKSCSLCCGDTT